MNDCPMEPNCHGLDAQRAKLESYVVDQGMDRDQVLAAFARDYGTQAILARPIDKGFNRLAWIFPYLVGIAGACAAVVIARRWSSRPATESQPATEDDPALRTRLDDELRDLD
jgi:cytochrome c-type biogenesis protein CcmH/NrfF